MVETCVIRTEKYINVWCTAYCGRLKFRLKGVKANDLTEDEDGLNKTMDDRTIGEYGVKP